MTSTVIRVKRRITDEPFDKFVLNCKRLKTSHNAENNDSNDLIVTAETAKQTDDTKTILKLAATVSDEDDLRAHLTKLRKTEAEEMVRKVRKPDRVINKLREQFKDDAQNQRYKVVNCFRSIDDATDSVDVAEGSTKSNNITIVDVIKEELLQAQTDSNQMDATETATTAAIDKSDNKFVYDLYLVQSGEQPTEIDINNYTIRPFDDLVYQANDDTLNNSVDSEDSNEEAHWRNEYPDTDDGLSIGEEDMRRAVEDLNFGSDADNLSSDDDDGNYGDDPVVHFMDESDDEENEYDYFKKHGRVRNNAAYYRKNRRNPRNQLASDEDSDIEPSSNSSASSVSPLNSCDENSDAN